MNPPSLTWDEVAWGYNAYSLGLNGKDEFGRFLPYDYLESFGDFKPPLYAYLDIIPVKIFGLTEFAVRFPSALFGVLTVLFTYFLTVRIFINSKIKNSMKIAPPRSGRYSWGENWKLKIPIIATALLAFSPWHIMLSRAAFEANVATFFLVFGVYSFIRGIQDRSKYIIFSAVSFALSFYTFNTPRIVAPLLVITLLIAYRKNLWHMKKLGAIAFFTGLIMLLPIVNFLSSPQAKLRYEEVNIFSNLDLIKTSNQEIENDRNEWWSKIIHNRRVFFAREYMKHYFDNLSLDFLFIKGDGNPKFSVQDVGQMYLWELPFLIVGILFLFRKREGSWFIIPLWLILGIIPAATARETPHALRIETILPTVQILVAYGIVNSYIYLKKYRKLFLYSLSAIVTLNLIYFLHILFVLYPWEFSGTWQYGYEESVNYVRSEQNKYDRIIVEDTLGRPYIYYLFYLQIPPDEFRKTAVIKRDAFGFVNIDSFNKFIFTKTINDLQKREKALYITSSDHQIPGSANPLKIIYRLDGTPALKAYKL